MPGWYRLAGAAVKSRRGGEFVLAAGKDLTRTLPDAVFGYRHCMAALTELGRLEEATYYRDIIFERFAKEITFFITTIWGEWRPVDHARYVATLAKGGLMPRDGVLTRTDPRLSAPI